MRLLSLFGTGPYRLLYMGLALLAAIGIIFGAYKAFTGHYVNIGRNQVTNQINNQNAELTNRVSNVNDNIAVRVTNSTAQINKNSQVIEDEVHATPSQPISNVTLNRLERVHEQQRSG